MVDIYCTSVWWRVIKYTNCLPIAYFLYRTNRNWRKRSVKHMSSFCFCYFSWVFAVVQQCPSTTHSQNKQYWPACWHFKAPHMCFHSCCLIRGGKLISLWFSLVVRWPHVTPSLTPPNINQSKGLISWNNWKHQFGCAGPLKYNSFWHFFLVWTYWILG